MRPSTDSAIQMCRQTAWCLMGLSVFSGIRKTPVIRSLERLIETVCNHPPDPLEYVRRWSKFIRVFIQEGNDQTFFRYFINLILADENTFTLIAERGEFQEQLFINTFVSSDIKNLAFIARFNIPLLLSFMIEELRKARHENAAQLLEDALRIMDGLHNKDIEIDTGLLPGRLLASAGPSGMAAYIRERGAGMLGGRCFFSWNGNNGLIPAQNPDMVQLDDLYGYEDARRIVLENTARFIKGDGANNILLYGDRGTGKSATVKAVCAHFQKNGLRLVEVRKQQLNHIPAVLSTLARRGMRFILFIDDLSFESQDDEFTMLKGLLEGGIEARPDNVIVYATSNRRHFVKEAACAEPLSPASGSRAFDTVQEQLSLADRFGVTAIFTAPSQDEYLRITEFLAEKRGLFTPKSKDGTYEERRPLDKTQFLENAKRWERWFNGRSPRTARQFVEWAAGGERYPWE